MSAVATAFDVPRFLTTLRAVGCSLGEPFHYFQSVGSTNDAAKQALRAGAPVGSVFVADTQTAGRGRQGKAWHSPPGAGLWFSVLVAPLATVDLSLVTLLVGVALRRSIEKYFGHDKLSGTELPGTELTDAVPSIGARAPTDTVPKIKWPNDIELAGKKVAGILVEADLAAHPTSIVGIGVNTTAQFDRAQLPQAASLTELGAPCSREALLLEILQQLERAQKQFARDGATWLTTELRAYDALLGEQLRVGDVEGQALGIDASGGLVLATAQGRQVLHSGSVERLRALGS